MQSAEGSSKRAMGSMGSRCCIAIAVAVAMLLAACGGQNSLEEALDDLADQGPSSSASLSDQSSTSQAFDDGAATVLEIELGTASVFTMPEGMSQVTADFEVPAGSVVTISAEAPESNRSDVFLSIGATGAAGSQTTIGPGAEPAIQRLVTAAESGTRWRATVQSGAGESIRITTTAVPQDDAEAGSDAGENAGNPTAITVGAAHTGLLEGADTSDWYLVPISGGEVIDLRLNMIEDTGFGGVTASVLFNGRAITTTSVFPGGEESSSHIFSGDQSGDVFVGITGSGTYGFEVTTTAQDDGASGGDAGPDLGSATAAAFGSISGILGGDDTSDVYELALPADAVVQIQASEPVDEIGALDIELQRGGDRAARLELTPGATAEASAITINDADEIAYLSITGRGSYDIVISSSTQSDGGDGTGDAGGDAATAKEIDTTTSFEGWLGGDDGRDFYAFTPTVTGPIDIAVSLDPEFGGSTRVTSRGTGAAVADFRLDAGGSGNETAEYEAGQTYTVQVQSPGKLHYTLTLTQG